MRAVGGEVNNVPVPPRPRCPSRSRSASAGQGQSTQETFGRLLTGLASHAEVAARLVTTSPDVSVSTNLGGWINKLGVFAPADEPDFLGEGRLLRWRQGPTGHHVELGISEMNLFLMLGQLGLGHELHGEMLLPIGTVYDPFVCRGLDALDLRRLQRQPLHRGRHAVGHLAGARGRRPPEHDHPVDRHGAARRDLRRAGLRHGARLAAVRRPARLADPDGDSHVPAALDAPDRPGAVRGGAGRASATSSCGPTCWPAVTGWSRARGGWSDGEPGRLAARSCPRRWPRPPAGRRGCRGPRDRRDLHGRLYAGWRSPRAPGRDGTAPAGDSQLARLLPAADRGRRSSPSTTPPATRWPGWLRVRRAGGARRGGRVRPVRLIAELYGVFDLLPEQLVNAALVAVSGSSPPHR